MQPIIITSGEPAGVGPDLCLDLLNSTAPQALVVIGDRALLATRAEQLGCRFDAVLYTPGATNTAQRMVWDLPLNTPVTIGKPSPAAAAHVLTQLKHAADGCMSGGFSAMLTAPISKEMILASGVDFIGQTEYIAACVGVANPVMLLAGPRLRTALVTTHLPLAQVAASISEARLLTTLRVLHNDLPRHFTTHTPPVLRVCGLNPHAGEGGYLGDEEQKVITPAINKAQAMGMNVSGPHSADTLYTTAQLPAVDCVLAMYHDQALPVSKVLDFDHTVNVTLGLPFLRVSPDHGTAAELAGSGRVRPHSMRAALALLYKP